MPGKDHQIGAGSDEIVHSGAVVRRGGRDSRLFVAPLATASAVGAALLLILRALVFGGAGHDDRSGCLPLVILSSSNKAALMDELADRYEDIEGEVAGQCVDLQVVSEASGASIDRLSKEWEGEEAPRPDVWSPASSSWASILRHRLAENGRPDIVGHPLPRVATSPQVIAMPAPMARALGWPNAEVGWKDVFDLATDPAGWGKVGHAEWGRFRLGKTDMTQSTSALNATIGTFLAATGYSSDLTQADIEDPRVTEFVRGVESAVVRYGDTSLTFLQALRHADDTGQILEYLSAVILEEKSVWDYNHGNPSGDPATLGDRPPPKVPLLAVYPREGTLLADHPYVVLDLPWVTSTKRQIAQEFLEFLHAPAQQQRFQTVGFRDFRGQPGPEITPANGLLPGLPHLERGAPEPPILDAIQRSWRNVQKRARILFLLDISGSMGTTVRQADMTKLELMRRSIEGALGALDPGDEVGIRVFSPPAPDGEPFTELAPVAPLRDRAAALAAIGQLSSQPRGGSQLYAALRAAIGGLRAGFDPARINAVVLVTDGRNEDAGDNDLEALLRVIAKEATLSGVQVFPVAFGTGADTATLARIADQSRTQLYEVADPIGIDQVLLDLVANF